MKGRKATPNAVKELRGTDRPCRMRDEMKVDPIENFIVSLPKDSPLKASRAKKIFIAKANQLIAMRILTNFDLEQLSMYSFALDQAYTAMELLHKEGVAKKVLDEDGLLKRYVETPYLKILRDMIEISNKIGADFGFSPMSRQKLKAEKPKEKSPVDELNELLGQ